MSIVIAVESQTFTYEGWTFCGLREMNLQFTVELSEEITCAFSRACQIAEELKIKFNHSKYVLIKVNH